MSEGHSFGSWTDPFRQSVPQLRQVFSSSSPPLSSSLLPSPPLSSLLLCPPLRSSLIPSHLALPGSSRTSTFSQSCSFSVFDAISSSTSPQPRLDANRILKLAKDWRRLAGEGRRNWAREIRYTGGTGKRRFEELRRNSRGVKTRAPRGRKGQGLCEGPTCKGEGENGVV